MKRPIPFVPNLADDIHCSQAVMRMVLRSDNRTLSFKKIDQLLGLKKRHQPWGIEIMYAMRKLGYHGIFIDAFDYRRLAREGLGFLRRVWTPNILHWELQRTSVPRLIQVARKQSWIERPATIEDIKFYIDRGWIVSAVTNSRFLHNKGGYLAHDVLVLSYTKRTVTIHDPGKPARAGWKIGWKKFDGAFANTIKAWRPSKK